MDEKIELMDPLIDEIVYELYGVTDEEVEIVGKAVGEYTRIHTADGSWDLLCWCLITLAW
ncbi:hypothetical protein J2751_002335 [Halorubrum alkaliphilum]|uniref:Uncharacterized protein n=1 Tax=Halorubrum alkaliphilum TaxID=261290 RepID=A0A8T4GGF5_9EURY|nr:hypothetical protein [Halorubrum alkaliphilum]MBP1923296.1 hypothetical protein [Halorubrum alkaliphilum]